MKAIVWTAVNELKFQEMPRPAPQPGEAMVRVSHAGICGSDLHIWHGEHPRARPPLVLGHEFCGWVEEPAGEGSDFEKGEAVVVYPVIGCGDCELCHTGREYICGRLGLIGIDRDGGMAEYVSVPVEKLHRLPENLDPALGALVEPVAVGVHVLGRGGSVRDETVAIVGAGPIGLSVGLSAMNNGAARVLVSDVSAFRLQGAESLGFAAVNVRERSFEKAVLEATQGQGAACVFEATGIPDAAKNVEKLAAIGGRIVIVGIFPKPVPVDLRDISFRELVLIGTRHYTPREFDEAIRIAASGRFPLEALITDIYPLEKGIKAFDRTASGTDNIKVLVRVQATE